jgi:cytidyltransferase-like protein
MSQRVVGTVVEYNPFHNGHLYHIQQAKQQADTDLCVCVMSGHFLQRGEPALVDKWIRAEMAVAGGVDLVLELPYVYAGQTAETFASGGVAMLQATGLVTHLAFGSETTDLALLAPIADMLITEPQDFQDDLKVHLDKGLPFPAARQQALLQYFSEHDECLPADAVQRLPKVLSRPNTILGLEYLKALRKMKSGIQPLPIQRLGADYHDPVLTDHAIASATAIRLNLQKAWQPPLTWKKRRQMLSRISNYVPASTVKILNRAICMGKGPVLPEHFASLLQYALRRSTSEELADVGDVREGLEHRILTVSRTASSWTSILEHLKTKRFPRTTLQRILIQILLGYTQNDAFMTQCHGPAYLRVLGFSQRGQDLLRMMKDTASLPVVHRLAVFERQLWSSPTAHNAAALRMLDLDRLATDLFVLAYANPLQRNGGQDYTTQHGFNPEWEENT